MTKKEAKEYLKRWQEHKTVYGSCTSIKPKNMRPIWEYFPIEEKEKAKEILGLCYWQKSMLEAWFQAGDPFNRNPSKRFIESWGKHRRKRNLPMCFFAPN